MESMNYIEPAESPDKMFSSIDMAHGRGESKVDQVWHNMFSKIHQERERKIKGE